MPKEVTIGRDGRMGRVFATQTVVARLYDWGLGWVYDIFMGIFAPGYRSTIIRFYEAHLQTGQNIARVLEVGPGTGYVTQVLLKKFPSASVTCFDISSRMLNQLRKRLRPTGNGATVRFVQGDITRRGDLADHSFQLIVAQSVIEHLPDLTPAFSEMFRLLEPSGTLIVSDIGDNFWGRLFAFVFRVRSFTKPQICRVLEAAGFQRIEFKDYKAMFHMRGTLFFAQARKPVGASVRSAGPGPL